MKYIDTHSHFNLEQFNLDRDEAIERMLEKDIGTICVGVDYQSSKEAITIAQVHPDIWATIGLHPTHWGQEFDSGKFEVLATSSRVVAIGECGLDYFREFDRQAKTKQREVFKAQIALAQKLDLPLVLHIRPQIKTEDAYEDALFILQEAKNSWPSMRGTAHFFIGSSQTAERFINLGFHISFSGVVTIFPEYQSLVQSVPLDRILAETDAPFAAPLSHRGHRNEPIYVFEIIEKIAQIKEKSLSEIEAQLLKNAQTLFKLA